MQLKKIMIVDDSKVIGVTTKNSLEEISPDYSILYVDSGETCLNILKHNSFDLILLDIEMPNMNGWQVFKKIRENNKWNSIPVVFLTGLEDNFSKAMGKLLGNAFLEKGLGTKELKEKIEYVMANPIQMDESKQKIIEKTLQDCCNQ